MTVAEVLSEKFSVLDGGRRRRKSRRKTRRKSRKSKTVRKSRKTKKKRGKKRKLNKFFALMLAAKKKCHTSYRLPWNKETHELVTKKNILLSLREVC